MPPDAVNSIKKVFAAAASGVGKLHQKREFYFEAVVPAAEYVQGVFENFITKHAKILIQRRLAMKNKKVYQKIFGVIMILFLGAIICPNTAYAKNKYVAFVYDDYGTSKSTIVYSAKDKKYGYYYNIGFRYGTIKNVKISTSKPAVGKVKLTKNGDGEFIFYPKKAGTTTVKVSAVVDGKKITKKKTIKVVKFTQPFKTLRIDGKNCLRQVKSSNTVFAVKTKNKNAKFSYTLNKGWEVETAWDDCIMMKKKKSYGLTEYDRYLLLKNKKTGVRVTVHFYKK